MFSIPWLVGRWRLVLEVAVIAIALIWISVVTIQRNHYKADRDAIQAQFGAFKDQVSRLGKEAEARAKQREADDAKRIAVAVAGRADALRRLSDERSRSGQLSVTPKPPAGSDRLCFDAKAFDAAVSGFVGEVSGLVTAGDTALIDSKALLEAWPKP